MNTKYKSPLLVVENNSDDIKKLEKLLEDSGVKCEVKWCNTLFEALSMLESNDFDLTLLSLNLPDSQGFRTVSNYFQKITNTPLIVLGDTNNDIIANQSVKAGAQDFLVKPQLDSRTLGRAIRFAIQRSKDRMKLEEKARELSLNRRRFMEAQKMAHFGTWEMDLVSNKMDWSDEVFRIFNFHPGSIKPSLSEYMSYVHVEDKDKVEGFFEAITKSSELNQVEHRIVMEGTNIRFLTIQGKIQVEENSGKILLVGSIQDITDRKMSERLIIDKNISSKTAKIQEEVLSDLSFQIRTPLSSVVNLLFLLENTDITEQQDNYLADLKTSVDDLGLSVNNLLNFSVMVSDNVKLDEEEINIREFLQGAKNVLAIKAAAKSLDLILDIGDDLPEKIITDPKKLTQVLYNLSDNAIKFTENGKKVVISASASDKNATKMNLVLNIKDEGIGMDEAKIKQLKEAEKLLELDPEDLEEPNKKRQLGLAIATKLTNTMGGQMDIKSKVGIGSEFTIEIPARIPRQAKFGSGDAPDAPLKILLVEDHFLNQMATKKVLTSWSDFVTVDIAENGLVGVEKFREYGYDLILMDIQMPVMDGLVASRKIRDFSDVPIIALTANSTKQEQDKCMEIGMNDYLAKPFKPQELYGKIMNMLALVSN